MPADDSLSMDQISALFPQLENIQLVGAKGPQQIFTATLKSNFAPVMLRVVPTEEAGVFGWDPEFIVRSLTIVEQAHQGLLRVYEVGQAGPFTFILSEHSPYPRLADLETLPQISPQAALNLVRNMAEGLLTLHRKNIFHGGITPKLISLRADGGDALLLPINIYPAQPPVDMGDFASPEWVTGAEAAFTPGMDIYALGLTLYILLTRKTPMEAGFAMPSTLIKCSDAVDAVVSRAINPDTRERYRNLGDFITDLDKAIASPTGRNAAAIPPRPSSTPVPAMNMQKGQTNVYYYLIPALIVGIVLTYTCILYKKDVVRMRNDYNEQVQKENNAKADEARKANREARRHAPATPAPSAPAGKHHSGPCGSRTCPAPASGTRACSSQTLRRTRQSQLEPSARRQGAPELQPQHAGRLRSGKGRGRQYQLRAFRRFHQRHRRGGRKNRLVRHRLRQGDQPHHRKSGYLHASQPDSAGHHGGIQGDSVRQ